MATQSDRMYSPGLSTLQPVPSATERIVVLGASGHASVVLDICRLEGRYQVVGLLDSYKPCGSTCRGHEVIGSWEDLPKLVAAGTVAGAIVAIGDNWRRARIVANIRGTLPDFRFVTAVHPSAQVAEDVVLGAGSVVMAGAVVNPGSEVGEFCIVNTRASLDHECVMDDYSSLGPGAVVGGCVRIGAYTAIGIGAVVLQEMQIGTHTVIGASSTVFEDVPENVVAYGTPARVIRARQPGDPYLNAHKSPR